MAGRNRLTCLICMVILMLPFLNVSLVSATSNSWSRPRPSSYTVFDETVGNTYADDIASVGIGVHIYDYVENESTYAYDDVHLRVSVSANTRKGIYYDWMQYSYSWYEVSNPTGISGDNAGAWIDIPPELGMFLFYGVEYHQVWVCSNGFVCFDSEYTTANPSSIPNANEPNTFVAPLWRNLDPSAGGSIAYGLIYGTPNLFVISWQNVPNKANGAPQTFQLIIRGRVGGANEYHNALLFQYKSITKDQPTTVGVEDQIGSKGTSIDPNSLNNNYCLLVEYPIMGYRVERLTIKLTKSDNHAKVDPLPSDVGGYNVVLQNYTNPYGELFGAAIGFAAGLFLPYEAGIMFGTLLIIPALGNYFSGQLSKPDFQYDWADTNENEAYVTSACVNEEKTWLMPFDATLADIFLWRFNDNNNLNHFLTVTAELTYKSMDDFGTHTISTSATLNMYVPPKLYIDSTLWGTTNPYPGTYTYTYGTLVTVTAVPWEGCVFDYWILDGVVKYGNPITVNMTADHSLKAYFHDPYPGGGDGCPTLFVWDGYSYVDYSVIDIHNPTGEDVIRQVPIQAKDVEIINYKATFRLREGWPGLNFSESVIDQVKLYTVDNYGNRHICPIMNATHSQFGNVLPQLLFSDDWKVQTLLLETIDLKFVVPYQNIQSFIFIIEGCNQLKA